MKFYLREIDAELERQNAVYRKRFFDHMDRLRARLAKPKSGKKGVKRL